MRNFETTNNTSNTPLNVTVDNPAEQSVPEPNFPKQRQSDPSSSSIRGLHYQVPSLMEDRHHSKGRNY